MKNKITILILEDNPSDLDLIAYELKKLKLETNILYAKNRKEYTGSLSRDLPEIILSDYNLPDIDGEEALDILRNIDKSVPFILVSATIGEEKAVQLMRKGANDFVMKDKLKKLVPAIEREIKEYENRKQAAKEHLELIESRNSLKESEKKFRSLAENSGDRIERYDKDCRHTYINPVSLAITGLKKDDVIGKTHKELGYPESEFKFWDSLIKEVFKTGAPNGCVLEIRTGGATKYYDWKLYPESDENGDVVSVLSVSRDITDLKKSELELKQAHEKMVRAEKIANIGHWELDFRTGKMEASEGARKIYGFPMDKIIRLSDVQACAVSDFRPMLDKALKDLIDYHFGYDVDYKIIAADSRELKSIRSIAAYDDSLHRIFGIVQDTTEVKNAQQELQKLTTAVEQSPSIIVLTDTNGCVEYVNPRFTQITGYVLKEIQSKNPRVLKSGEMTDEIYSDLWKTIRSGKVWKGEFRNRKKSGELYWEGASIGPVFDINGNIINYMKLSQDITEKKRLEKDLLKEKDSLLESNRELEQFAYIASHDLQEPLRIISSFAQLLDMKHSHRLNNEAKEYISYIVNGAKRMQNLVKGLLDYSRITSRTKPKTVCNLSTPLKDALYNLNLSINETKTKLIINELPDAIVEQDQIAHIFQNLIGNAIKFKKDGEPCVIEVGYEKDKQRNELIIYVKDNGIGIDSNDFDKVFVIFKRLAAAAKRSGDGIGLALCKRIIERQGGKIWVESEGQNKGSVFKFSLPVELKDGTV